MRRVPPPPLLNKYAVSEGLVLNIKDMFIIEHEEEKILTKKSFLVCETLKLST